MKIRPMPEPFYKPTPGERLRDVLELEGMDAAALADRAGLPAARVSSLLGDKAPPTDEDAVAISRVWGQSANFWRELFGLPKVAQRRADRNIMLWTTAERKETIKKAAAARHVAMSQFILDAIDAALAASGKAAAL